MFVKFRGYKLDPRTVDMILWAEHKAGFGFRITQGSYNKGGVAASAGTHDGGGCVDFSIREVNPMRRVAMVRALKDAGFAAWYRPDRPGVWPPHIHAVAIGCKDLAPIAKRQVTAYDAKRDGLVSNNKDSSYRPNPPVIFNEKKGQPVPRVKKILSRVINSMNRMRVE